MDWGGLVLSFLTVLTASGAGYITIRATRKKLIAETRKIEREGEAVIANAAVSLVQPLEKRIKDLEDLAHRNDVRIAHLEEELEIVRLWAQTLWRQVIRLGGDPVSFDTIMNDWRRSNGRP